MSYDDLIAKLALVYPGAFFVEQNARRPLAIGIHRDLRSDASHGLTDAELRTALHRYCTSPDYLASMIEGTDRIGLDGLAAGSVSAEAVAAAVKIARLSQKSRERREIKAEKAVAVVPEQQTEKASTPAPITAPNGKRIHPVRSTSRSAPAPSTRSPTEARLIADAEAAYAFAAARYPAKRVDQTQLRGLLPSCSPALKFRGAIYS